MKAHIIFNSTERGRVTTRGMVEDPSGKGGRAGGYRNGDYMILAKLLKYSFPIIWDKEN